jgi:hypothetical protein
MGERRGVDGMPPLRIGGVCQPDARCDCKADKDTSKHERSPFL